MSLTAQQEELRRTRIGASEISAVLGIDKYRTPLQLWMQKKLPRPQREADDHRNWGLDIESAILHNYARRHGYDLLPSPGSITHPTLPLVCTPDGLGARNGRVRDIQSKNVEEHHANEWGEPGTAQGPLGYVAQVTIEVGVLRTQPEVLGLAALVEDAGDLAVSFGGRPPLGYPIPFNAELFGNLADAAAKFVRDHLEPENNPPPIEGDRAAMEYVKRRYRASTGEVKPPTPEAVEIARKLRDAKERGGSTDAEIEQLQAQLCALIGEAQGIEGVCNWPVIKEQRAAVTDWPLVVEQIAAWGGIERERVTMLVKTMTREEVVKQSYRRLSLAKERKAK